MTAEQAYPAIKTLIEQVQDLGERKKLENLILGAVESRERKKAQILAQLDKKERYQIKSKTKKKL
ncbi:hypothetical protein G6R40_01165 [Chryseobacterium sp. POL2]|uniref:hypothetical protein n=1 Tax=Chryseobacterium sp. POL2 TaxID=2713414 RepID=UPI0013E1F656|nr:hypothetical protein [Chryseobacterium sp. POL2]QIG88348.1 hypothetical protein G6R40_01165 [Chryseobacterium sp. POL2]